MEPRVVLSLRSMGFLQGGEPALGRPGRATRRPVKLGSDSWADDEQVVRTPGQAKGREATSAPGGEAGFPEGERRPPGAGPVTERGGL